MSTHGQIGYVEIPVSDLAGSAEFYARLFGWTFARDPEGSPDYWVFAGPSDPQMGALERVDSPPRAEGGPLVYVTVDDLDATIDLAAAAGGTVERGRTEIGLDHGSYALIRDPDGNRLGLFARS